MAYSQKQRILIIMTQNRNVEWWRASDLMELSKWQVSPDRNLFVGYECTARLSELIREIPEIFNVREVGRFREVSINWKEKEIWWPKLPRRYQLAIWREKQSV